jgi:hypothetical protein
MAAKIVSSRRRGGGGNGEANQYAGESQLVKWRRENRLELAGWRHRLKSGAK